LGLMYVTQNLGIVALLIPNLLWLLNALYLTYQTQKIVQ